MALDFLLSHYNLLSSYYIKTLGEAFYCLIKRGFTLERAHKTAVQGIYGGACGTLLRVNGNSADACCVLVGNVVDEMFAA